MSQHVLGIDIGGANLKFATSDGHAISRPFALWKQSENLALELASFCRVFAFDAVALTMTGELCDCFATKREGVLAILNAAICAFPNSRIDVWRVDGQFIDVATALANPLQCAASNWLAIATFASRLVSSDDAIVVDVGSTTCDVIPIQNGVPVPKGRTDFERLRTKELVYTGVRRTPVCSLLGSDGMAEFFATMNDVYSALNMIDDDMADYDTADGRPATRQFALARLARMLGGDCETVAEADIVRLAEQLHGRQVGLIQSGIDCAVNQFNDDWTAVVCGSGEWLARQAIAGRAVHIVSFREKFGHEISTAAAAYAVAMLATERLLPK